ncbi:MAG: hypothetical protein H7301_10130 [Cryobacterium sp.]|nr:hypothetical protein [Oligoflexia bacterium]
MHTASRTRRIAFLVSILSCFGLFSCSSARMNDTESDALFRSGRYEASSTRLRAGLEKEGVDGRDGLLYLLDLGLSEHSAGKVDEAIKAFRLADQTAEIKDYTSLSTETATLLTTDQIKQYKGEDFENVLINVYLAMDYAAKGDRESAIVEAKRVNRKLYLMNTEGKRKYAQNAFARYLSGILYEADRNYNDAYVDYKLTAELLPKFPGIGRDLWAMAWKMGDRDDRERWEKEFPITEAEKNAAKARVSLARPAEIVVLYENGISPRKIPDAGFHSIPKFFPRANPVKVGMASVSSDPSGESFEAKTNVLMDIEAVAIENLREKWGGLLAKKLAGAGLKIGLGAYVNSKTKDSGLGTLLALALDASDQADTRSWNLLPRDLQVARFPVKGGTYTVKLSPLGASPLPAKTVQVKPGEKAFVTFRYMP